MFAGATGVPGMNRAMGGDCLRGKTGLLKEFADKRLETFKLPFGGGLGFEVADQADANA